MSQKIDAILKRYSLSDQHLASVTNGSFACVAMGTYDLYDRE